MDPFRHKCSRTVSNKKAPPYDRPLPHESGRAGGGNLKEILMHSRFYFAGTASIHFHNALSFVNMMSPAISVYFQLNIPVLT